MLRQLLGHTLTQAGMPEGGIAPGFGSESVGLAEGPRLGYALYFLGRIVAAQASMMGYRDGFLVSALGFLLAVPPALLMRRGSQGTA